jgi:ribonuclease BN (tRNA processing enzyme)
VRLTVLGVSAARPNAGGACSGYLVEAGGRRYLVDCGPGVLSALLLRHRLTEVDAILLSHAHPDHCLGLVMVRQDLVHGPPPHRETPLPLYAPEAARGTLDALGEAFDDGFAFWSEAFDVRWYDVEGPLVLDGVDVQLAATNHYVPTAAMRFETDDGVLVYTADTGPSDAVTRLASGADLLLAEATMAVREDGNGGWGHLSAVEAGEMARTAGVRRLLLTHYFTESDPDRICELAARAAGAGIEVDLAREGRSYDVGR